MRLHTGIAAIATAAVWAFAGVQTAAARGNPPCYVSNGHLYCGNYAPTPIYQRPSLGREDSAGGFHPVPIVDTLRSNPSYFECWVYGDQHGGGNNVWYYTYGDDSRRYGYVPAEKVFTQQEGPSIGMTKCP